MQYHISRYAELRFPCEAVGSIKKSENRNLKVTHKVYFIYIWLWGQIWPSFKKRQTIIKKLHLRMVYKIEARMIN